MLTVLPSAPPRDLEIASASVGPWNESGGTVRFMRPLSSSGVISSLVEAGEICSTPSLIETERATGIETDDAQEPAMQLAPSETSLRAADTPAWSLVWSSSVLRVTV